MCGGGFVELLKFFSFPLISPRTTTIDATSPALPSVSSITATPATVRPEGSQCESVAVYVNYATFVYDVCGDVKSRYSNALGPLGVMWQRVRKIVAGKLPQNFLLLTYYYFIQYHLL